MYLKSNQTWLELTIENKIVILILLLKHTRKDFEIIIALGHSEFITSQSMFVPTNCFPRRYLACWTFSKCQRYSKESCLSIRVCTYKINVDNQLHNCICGVLSIQDGGVINILAKSLRRRTIELLWLLCIVMLKWITRNRYRTSCAANNIVNCLILNRLFSKNDAW